jgi:transposase
LDATSFHVDGEYNHDSEPPEGVIHITPGYSRDHRPDLNQIVLQLICENQAGIPLWMAPMNGNSNDQTGFRQTIETHIEQMKTNFGMQLLVADSALYNGKTLQSLGEFPWISRVPEIIVAAREITWAVAEDLMGRDQEQIHCAVGVTYGGVRQRWRVVYTRAAQERAKKTLRKQYRAQGEKDQKAFDRLGRQAFACEADAQVALEAYTKQHTGSLVCESRIVARPRYAKQGRPAKTQSPDRIEYFIEGGLASVIETYRRKLQRKSCFIVATNELDESLLSDERVIEAYKKDQQKVERGFRFLKDPKFMASTVFLKSPKRIMALLMIMTLCLFVYGALEYRIRRSLRHHRQTFPHQKGHATERPTARWVFQFFSGIHVLLVDSLHEWVLNLNSHHRSLLALLGERYVALYANSA